MQKEQLKKLLDVKNRRLHQLELQRARKGINTEPEVIIEIEDLEKEISDLERQIGAAQGAAPVGSPDQQAQALASLINLGQGNTIGNLTIGSVTGRDSYNVQSGMAQPSQPVDPAQVGTPPPHPAAIEPPQIYLAAHPRLSGVADGRPGETVIDWARLFIADDPKPEAWQWRLIPDLETQQQAFRHEGKNLVRLRAFARNSAGLAFGFIFCQRAGFHIHYKDNRGDLWRTDEAATTQSPLTRIDTNLNKERNDLVLELAVTQPAHSVTDPVDRWLHDSSGAPAVAAAPPQGQFDAVAWRDLLNTYFSESELQDLCFDLRIDYESLPVQGKSNKARELVAYAERAGRSADLLRTCRRMRPRVNWDSVIVASAAVPTRADTIRKRILLTLERDPFEITAAEGAAIARQACDLISREGRLDGTVHLFGALPMGIPLLIGWGLKAGRSVQFYDLDSTLRAYQPTCLLRA